MKKRTNAVTAGMANSTRNPPIGNDKARNDGSHRKPYSDNTAIDGKQTTSPIFRRKIEQGLVHDGEIEARGNGLNESRRHQGGKIPGHHAKHGADERHDQPEEHDLPQTEAVEREGCKHNDNTRHDGIAEHQQVRLGQAHVVLCRNIVERDVHERLHQRGKQVAREQHHDHRLAVFCGLLVLNSHISNSYFASQGSKSALRFVPRSHSTREHRRYLLKARYGCAAVSWPRCPADPRVLLANRT